MTSEEGEMSGKILAADIGGTNSRFAFFSSSGKGRLRLESSKWLETQEAGSFSELLGILGESDFPLKAADAEAAVVAVAGPGEGGVYSAPPFIDWKIDFSRAGEDYGFRKSLLINDFVAQAFACRSPVGEDAKAVLPGQPEEGGTMAVVGAGTGLGKAALCSDGSGGYIAVPSEGGHASFAVVNRRELEFQEFIRSEFGEEYLTGNTVLSGRGLSLIHRFLTGEKVDSREVISKLNPGSETLDWGARFYGRICRNYCLETLALGGLYVAGGVAARSPHLLTDKSFEREFRSSPTMSALLAKIPVFLIENQESGLWGAARLGQQIIQKEKG